VELEVEVAEEEEEREDQGIVAEGKVVLEILEAVIQTKEAVIMTDLKCLTLSALIAEKIAKFLLNQEEISQFCVVLVLEEMMAEEMKDQEEKTEIQEAEEKKKECTMLFAVNVVEILNYHLDLLEIEPYTAKDALMEVKKR
jgi:mannose/fructose-specific phosphotransferase system component IIA